MFAKSPSSIYVDRIKILKSYPARSAAVDNWDVVRGERFGAPSHAGPVVLLPAVVARVALDDSGWSGRSDTLTMQRSTCSAVNVVSVVVIVVVLISVVVCSPSTATPRSFDRYRKVCTKRRNDKKCPSRRWKVSPELLDVWEPRRRSKNIKYTRMRHLKSKIQKFSPQTDPARMFFLGSAVALDVPVSINQPVNQLVSYLYHCFQ